MKSAANILVTEQQDRVHRDIKHAQRELKASGFDCGAIDGQSGKWTQLATKYQQAAPQAVSLATTGRQLILAHALASVGKIPKSLANRLINIGNSGMMPGTVSEPARRPRITWNYNTALLAHWATLAYAPEAAALAIPVSYNSATLLAKPTWKAGIGGLPLQPGDLFGVWYESLGDIGHCGLILDWCPGEKYFLSIESQHSDLYTPQKDGWPRVCVRRRLRSDIHCGLHIDHEALEHHVIYTNR